MEKKRTGKCSRPAKIPYGSGSAIGIMLRKIHYLTENSGSYLSSSASAMPFGCTRSIPPNSVAN